MDKVIIIVFWLIYVWFLDQRSSRLFDNTTDNYTASWVSSTSSIPPEQKIPPDHSSRHNSPTGFEFTAWNAELVSLKLVQKTHSKYLMHSCGKLQF